MKRNRITAGFTLLLLVMCACLSHAQTAPWSYAAAYNIKAKSWSQVVTHPIGQLVAVAGRKNWNLDIDAFVGMDGATNRPTAGIAGDAKFAIAGNASFMLGLGAFVENARPVSAGILVGVSVKF